MFFPCLFPLYVIVPSVSSFVSSFSFTVISRVVILNFTFSCVIVVSVRVHVLICISMCDCVSLVFRCHSLHYGAFPRSCFWSSRSSFLFACLMLWLSEFSALENFQQVSNVSTGLDSLDLPL